MIATQDGKFERGRQLFPMADLGAGGNRPVTWKPSLADGTYTITAQVTLGDKLLDQAVASLQIGATRSHSSTGIILIGGALVALVIAVLVFLALKRRRPERRGQTPA